jgi:hypothetical protein
VQAVFPGQTPVDRTTMNFWEDTRVVEAVTYAAVIGVANEHDAGYDLGINCAKTMLGEHASEAGAAKKSPPTQAPWGERRVKAGGAWDGRGPARPPPSIST